MERLECTDVIDFVNKISLEMCPFCDFGFLDRFLKLKNV